MKRRILTLILAAAILILSGCVSKTKTDISAPQVTGSFEITVIKVGKADAIVLKTANGCVIIDCGENNSLEISVLKKTISFTLDDVYFEVSVPKKENYAESDNDFSLVISATHGKNTFLFAGDAETERLNEIIKEFGHKYDFLKVPHHGKYCDATSRFINTVSPTYAVICDCKKIPRKIKHLRL